MSKKELLPIGATKWERVDRYTLEQWVVSEHHNGHEVWESTGRTKHQAFEFSWEKDLRKLKQTEP